MGKGGVSLPLSWRVTLLAHTLLCFYFLINVAFWTRQWWRRRLDFGIVERKRSLVRMFLDSFLVFVLTQCGESWIIFFDLYHRTQPWSRWTAYLSILLSNTVLIIGFALVSLRAWLILYDISLAAATSDDQWVALITHPVTYKPDIVATLEDINASLMEDPHSVSASDHSVPFHFGSIFTVGRNSDTERKRFGTLVSTKPNLSKPEGRTGKRSVESSARASHGSAGSNHTLMNTSSINSGSINNVSLNTAGSLNLNTSVFGHESVNTATSVGLVSSSVNTTTTTTVNISYASRKSAIPKRKTMSSKTLSSRSRGITFTSVNGQGERTENWFIRNKNSFGNEQWFKLHSIWTLTIIVLMITIPQWFDSWAMFGRGIALIVFVLASMSIAVMFQHFPTFNDSLRIIAELRTSLSLSAAFSVVYCVSGVLNLTFSSLGFRTMLLDSGDLPRRRHRYLFWSTVITNSVMLMVGRLICLTQTKWVLLSFPSTDNPDESVPQCGVNHGYSQWRDVSVYRAWFGIEWIRELWQSRSKKGPQLTPLTTVSSAALSVGMNHPNGSAPRMPSEMEKMSQRTLVKDMPHLKVLQLLADEQGFRKFMNHLFHEFSYESLLCVIELQQFSDVLRKSNAIIVASDEQPTVTSAGTERGIRLNFAKEWSIRTLKTDLNTLTEEQKRDDNAGRSRQCRVRFPPSIQNKESSISCDSSLSKEQRFCILCKKYIMMDAEMSVNISFDTRMRLTQKCDYYLKGTLPSKVTDEESLERMREDLIIDEHCFDTVISELIRLMRDSLSRFQMTEEYTELRIMFFERLNPTDHAV